MRARKVKRNEGERKGINARQGGQNERVERARRKAI